jgi:hypothetical protein
MNLQEQAENYKYTVLKSGDRESNTRMRKGYKRGRYGKGSLTDENE